MQDEKKIEALAKELAKGLRTEKDPSALSRALLKVSLEAALEAEMDTLKNVSRVILSKSKYQHHETGKAHLNPD